MMHCSVRSVWWQRRRRLKIKSLETLILCYCWTFNYMTGGSTCTAMISMLSLIVAGMSAGFAHQYVGPKRVLNLPLAMTLSAESTGEQDSLYFHHDSFVVGLPWALLQVPWFYSWFISPNTRQMHRDPANRPALGCGLTQARAWSSGPWTDMIDSVVLL